MEGKHLSQIKRLCACSIFEKPIVTTFRNQSLDDLMTEAIKLRNELNGIGNNFNQAVKKLHTLQQIPEFRSWLITHELEKNILFNKIDEIKNNIQKWAINGCSN